MRRKFTPLADYFVSLTILGIGVVAAVLGGCSRGPDASCANGLSIREATVACFGKPAKDTYADLDTSDFFWSYKTFTVSYSAPVHMSRPAYEDFNGPAGVICSGDKKSCAIIELAALANRAKYEFIEPNKSGPK